MTRLIEDRMIWTIDPLLLFFAAFSAFLEPIIDRKFTWTKYLLRKLTLFEILEEEPIKTFNPLLSLQADSEEVELQEIASDILMPSANMLPLRDAQKSRDRGKQLEDPTEPKVPTMQRLLVKYHRGEYA
jgi:hypothetical protein